VIFEGGVHHTTLNEVLACFDMTECSSFCICLRCLGVVSALRVTPGGVPYFVGVVSKGAVKAQAKGGVKEDDLHIILYDYRCRQRRPA
jgi:hypothetical protein